MNGTTSNVSALASQFFYQKNGLSVGPIDHSTLQKLHQTGLIGDETKIRAEEENEWEPFGVRFKRQSIGLDPVLPDVPQPVSYYYLDGANRPVGPISLPELCALLEQNIVFRATLIAADGGSEWLPLGQLIGGEAKSESSPLGVLNNVVTFRNLAPTTVFSVLSLGIYWLVYLVPSYTRDMEAITRRPRLGFAATCILGIVTLGIFSCVLSVIYAFELEKYGQEQSTPGRQSSFGLQILGLTLASFIIAFISGGLAFLVSVAIGGYITCILQKEINLYAKA